MKTGPKTVKIRRDANGDYFQLNNNGAIKKIKLGEHLQPMAASYQKAKIFLASDGEPVVIALTN